MKDLNRTLSPYPRRLALLILAATLIRLWLAFHLGLGNDEVYYYTYALQPDWNHFDHPPLVGLFIRAFSLNLHWLNQGSMRLTAILGSALGTWMVYRMGQLLHSEKAGWYAALLYTASLYSSIIAGLLILPDSPQMIFWTAALWLMLRIALDARPRAWSAGWKLLLLGLLIGLAIMSKIHGVFLWLAFGAYIVFQDRDLLKNPWLYASVLLTALIASPILFWNLKYHFITYRFQGARVAVSGAGLNMSSFATALGGQFFYNGPFNVLLYLLLIPVWRKGRLKMDPRARSLLLWSSLPLIGIVTVISLYKPVLPHWSGPAFTSLLLLAAVMLADGAGRTWTRRLPAIGLGFLVLVLAAGLWLMNAYPGSLHPGPNPKDYGANDFSLDMYGWKGLKQQFARLRQQDLDSGRMQASDPLVINKWFPGSHLYFYLARPLGMRVVGVGTLMDLHQYAWLNERNGYVPKGGSAYYITSSVQFADPDSLYGPDFTHIQGPRVLIQRRGGKICRYFFVYRLKGATRDVGKGLLRKAMRQLKSSP